MGRRCGISSAASVARRNECGPDPSTSRVGAGHDNHPVLALPDVMLRAQQVQATLVGEGQAHIERSGDGLPETVEVPETLRADGLGGPGGEWP